MNPAYAISNDRIRQQLSPKGRSLSSCQKATLAAVAGLAWILLSGMAWTVGGSKAGLSTLSSALFAVPSILFAVNYLYSKEGRFRPTRELNEIVQSQLAHCSDRAAPKGMEELNLLDPRAELGGTCHSLLGEGALGSVSLYSTDNQQFAVKSARGFEGLCGLIHEFEINVKLQQTRAIHQYGLACKANKMGGIETFLVMEYVEGRTLESALDQGNLKLSVRRHYIEETADFLLECLEYGVVPADLHAENILIDSDRQLRFIDMERYTIAQESQQTVAWIAADYHLFFHTLAGDRQLQDDLLAVCPADDIPVRGHLEVLTDYLKAVKEIAQGY